MQGVLSKAIIQPTHISQSAINECISNENDIIDDINILPRSTPSMIKKAFDHKIEMENDDQKNKYSCCCTSRTTDRRLLTFATLFSISILVLSFSFYQLTMPIDCSEQATYMSLITMVIGIWIKSPI